MATIPTLTKFSQGIGVFNADWGNTVTQGGALLANLRAFPGLANMTVYAIGLQTPGDGAAGAFYWNNSSIAADDGGITTIAPNGYNSTLTPGRWLRASVLANPITTVANIAALRALRSVPSQVVYVDGYTTGTDNGGGPFWYNSADTTSVDNGGTIIVDAAGHRWYRNCGGEAYSVLWFGGAIQNAIDAQYAANGGGSVYVAPGTYTITATLALRPYINLWVDDGATIKQGNGLNLAALIDCDTHTANGASVIGGGILDGNLPQNHTYNQTKGINIGGANDVRVDGLTLQNLSGVPVNVANGLRAVINGNTIKNTYGWAAIIVAPSTPQTASRAQITNNRILKPFGGHAILTQSSDWNVITGNQIDAQQVAGMTVSISGNTVTSSGIGVNNFLTNTDGGPIQVGSWIILGNGTTTEIELYITAVNTASSLTVSTAPGTYSNYTAIAGPGDLINVGSSSYNLISGNQLSGGAAGGIIVHDEAAAESTQGVWIEGNQLDKIGNQAISFQTANSGQQLFNCGIVGNQITDCGQGGNATYGNVGILILAGTDVITGITVDGNSIANIAGSTIQYWMQIGTYSSAGARIMCGSNSSYNMVNDGIQNGIESIVLIGWGSGASVSDIVSQGASFRFTITAGSSPSANPTAKINTRATTMTQPPQMVAKMVAGSGTIQAIYGEQNADATSLTLAYNGTPANGNTYEIYCVS